MLLALPCGAALAQVAADGIDHRGIDHRIAGPILEDMAAMPLPAVQVSWIEGDEGWRVSDTDFTPEAAFIARSVLSSRAPGELRYGLGAFSAPQAVIGRTANGGFFTVSVFDSEAPNWIAAALTPDGLDMPAWLFSADRERTRSVALRYEGRFDSYGGVDGLDIGLIPRAGLSMGDRGSATEFGATVRLGQYMDGPAGERSGWWFFAGADRQALIIEPGQRLDLRSALTLQPYAMVGDQQAGIAMRLYGADLSLAYVRRETSWSLPSQSWDEAEDFAAFSLTIRR